jgi:RNA polymerase sigma factor (sigma-70 family)
MKSPEMEATNYITSKDVKDIYDKKTGDLDSLGLYYREVGQIPVQKENHQRWGEEVFAGKMALKALNALSESDIIFPSQKEKVLMALEEGNFLLKRLNSRIDWVSKRLAADEYKHGQDKKLDEDFMKTVLANEELVSDILGDAKGIEDEKEKEMMLEQFIGRRINSAHQGQESLNDLVKSNLRLAFSIAKKYSLDNELSNLDMSLSDIIGYANEGLMIAAADYDPRRKTKEGKTIKFSTYATWWIKQSIAKAIADYGSMIRLPVHVHKELKKIRRAQEQDFQDNNKQPDELPEKLGDAFMARVVFSLDEPIKDGDNTVTENTMKDSIASGNKDGYPEEVAEINSIKDILGEAFLTLDEREGMVLERMYGLIDGRSRSLAEIGRELGVTRERIRQIKEKALKKLREHSLAPKLRAFI